MRMICIIVWGKHFHILADSAQTVSTRNASPVIFVCVKVMHDTDSKRMNTKYSDSAYPRF